MYIKEFDPNRYSYSKIRTYNTCPKQYKFNYIDGEENITFSTYRDLGIVIYKILEIIIDTEDLNESINQTIKSFNGNYDYDIFAEAHDMLSVWLNQENRFPYPVLATEKWLSYKIGKYTIVGAIDRLDKLSDTIYRVVDYKTGNFEYKEVQPGLQLDIYTLGMFKNYPQLTDIEFVYENIRYGTTASLAISRENMSILENRILAYLDAIDQDTEFNPKLGYHCIYCPFTHKCNEFQAWLKINTTMPKDINIFAKNFLEMRTKAAYYNGFLEDIKEILKYKEEDMEIPVEDQIVVITKGRVYVRNNGNGNTH